VTGGAIGVSWARMSIAAIVLLIVSAHRGKLRFIDLRSERNLVVAGALLALHFATWIASLQHASVAISTLLVCTTPVWTEAYAVIRRRRVDPYAALSIAGALAGVAIVVGAPDRANTPLGIVLAIAGAIAIAAYLILVRGVDARYDTLAITTRTYAYAAFALGIAMSWSGAAGALPSDWRGWAGVLAMALISQLFGHTLLNAAVRVLSATLVSTFTLLEPVIAGVLAAWIFHERLGATTAIGALVILASIGVALRGEQRAESAAVVP
jgi:drug/metabolite transporter (DMT)-like permease